MRKPAFCICENKDADQLAVTAKLISAFVFATLIVQSLYFLNLKFQASGHLLWPYSLVCIGLGRKPRRPVFSQGLIGMLKLDITLYSSEQGHQSTHAIVVHIRNQRINGPVHAHLIARPSISTLHSKPGYKCWSDF